MGVLPWPGGCALHLLRLVVGRRAGSQQRRSYARGAASSPLWDDPVHRLGSDVLRRMVLGLRSEEHTSELQSLMRISYAVFCLQKKKHINIPHVIPNLS